MHTVLCWVSGHVDVVENENADTSPRSVTTSIDRQASTSNPTHRHNGNYKFTVKKIGKDIGHSPNIWEAREIKPDIEVWTFSFNKNIRIETPVKVRNRSQLHTSNALLSNGGWNKSINVQHVMYT